MYTDIAVRSLVAVVLIPMALFVVCCMLAMFPY